jgi:hypothetical protein
MHAGRLSKLMSDRSISSNVDTQSRFERKSKTDDNLHPSKYRRRSFGKSSESQLSCETYEVVGSIDESDSALDETKELIGLFGNVTSFGHRERSRYSRHRNPP